VRIEASTRRDRFTHPFLGLGLLLEAAAWCGLCLWVAVGWWSIGAPLSYSLGSLLWIAPALPVATSGLATLRSHRDRRARIVIACLALALLMNLGVSVLALLGGTLGTRMASSSRALFLLAGVASALIAAALAHEIRLRALVSVRGRASQT
jgi:hypothetical protein